MNLETIISISLDELDYAVGYYCKLIDKIAHRYIDIFNLNEIVEEKFIADKSYTVIQ